MSAPDVFPLGFCMDCEFWQQGDAMVLCGYVPEQGMGRCCAFGKVTEASHGLQCTAFTPKETTNKETTHE